MAVVKMYITKFDREVLIDDKHPLAVAEVSAATEMVRGHDVRDEGRGQAQTSQQPPQKHRRGR